MKRRTVLAAIATALVGSLVGVVPGVVPGASVAPALAAPTWLASQALADNTKTAYTPTLAAAPDGTVLAVWVSSDGTNLQVEARIRPPGGIFGPPVPLSEPAGATSGAVAAFDADGEAVVTWAREGRIEASRRPPGGNFGPPVVVSSAAESCSGPAVVFGAAGDAVIAWSGQSGTPPNLTYRVWTRDWRADGGLDAPRELGSVTTGPGEFAGVGPIRLAADARGDVLVAWFNFVQQAPTISDPIGAQLTSAWAAMRPAGSPFQLPATSLDSGEEDGLLGSSVSAPSIALAPDGEALTVWSRREATGEVGEVVEAKARPAGGNFEAAAEPLSKPGHHAYSPSVAFDGSGNAVVAWDDAVGEGIRVVAAERPANAGFGAPGALSPPGMKALYPVLAITARGEAVVAWLRYGSSSQIEAAARPPGGGFGGAVPVSAPAGQIDLGRPDLAVDGQGDAVGIWPLLEGIMYVPEVAGYDAAGPALDALSVPAGAAVGTPLAFAVFPRDVWSALGATGWSFGDGASAASTVAAHAYAKPGSYPVTVTAADALGNTTSATATLPVSGGPATAGPASAAATATGTATAARVVRVKRGRALVRLRCRGTGGCRGTLKLLARAPAKGHAKARPAANGKASAARRKGAKARFVPLGKARFALAAGKRATVAVKLSRRAGALLRRAGKRGLAAQLRGSGVKHRGVVLKPTRRHRKRS